MAYGYQNEETSSSEQSNEKKVDECRKSQLRKKYNKKVKSQMEHILCYIGWIIYLLVQKTDQPRIQILEWVTKMQQLTEKVGTIYSY